MTHSIIAVNDMVEKILKCKIIISDSNKLFTFFVHVLGSLIAAMVYTKNLQIMYTVFVCTHHCNYNKLTMLKMNCLWTEYQTKKYLHIQLKKEYATFSGQRFSVYFSLTPLILLRSW